MNTQVEYLIGDDIVKVVENSIYNFYRGKVDFTGPNPDRTIWATTGLAGIMQFNFAIKERAIKSGLVINVRDIKMNEQSEYTSYIIPFLANVKFKIEPVFDPQNVFDDKENPFINEFRISSYNYKLTDENSGDTVTIIAKRRSTLRNRIARKFKKLLNSK